MNRSEFEVKLKKAYSGAVFPLTSYVNEQATLYFHCTNCDLKFYGKPRHIVGRKDQQHLCYHPYGDNLGERFQQVGSAKHKRKKKESLNIKQLNKMIWEDYTYKQIAQKLKVNPNIIKNYFEEEGLI